MDVLLSGVASGGRASAKAAELILHPPLPEEPPGLASSSVAVGASLADVGAASQSASARLRDACLAGPRLICLLANGMATDKMPRWHGGPLPGSLILQPMAGNGVVNAALMLGSSGGAHGGRQ